ncbi:MAG: AAA family ATPase [Vicinamibacterales bacterium]
MGSDYEWVFDRFRLDPAGRQLWQGPTAVPLRPKLFAALQYLVEHAGRLITREELLRGVWSRTHVDETLLRGTMRDLRAVLGDDAEAPRFIETIPHQGYRFSAAVRRVATSAAQSTVASLRKERAEGLIEREREDAQLQRSLAHALDRQRQIVFVTGEAGMGKTVLVDAFVETLPNRHGVLVGRGQCVEQYGGSEPYLPVLEAVRQLCRSRAGKRVMTTLQQHAPTWLVQLPALVSDSELDSLQRRTQGAGRDRMLREMSEALEALSVESPVVLVLEDVHWSDHSTIDLLGMLARRREPARVLVLATYRPADLIVRASPLRALAQDLQSRGLCQEISLGFLSEAAIRTYLAGRFEGGVDDTAFTALARSIHARTDGNPLFMVTVTDDLAARGVVALNEGGWRVQEDVASARLGVPDGLRPMIDRQLERLSTDDRRLLEAASVVGRTFSCASVAAALEERLDDVEDRCDHLGRRGLFIAEAKELGIGRFTFLHDLYLRALYDGLSTSRRTRLHRRIAEFGALAPEEQVREHALPLALHFEHAGDSERALAHLRQAATNALARHAFEEAIDLLRHALALLAPMPESTERDETELAVQIALSTPLRMVKGYAAPEVAAATARARELSERLPESPTLLPALLSMARLHVARTELDVAERLVDRLVRLSETAPDPLPLITDGVIVYISYFRGELETARLHAERGAAAYDIARHKWISLEYGDDPGVRCLGQGAWALWALGYPDRARTMAAAALDLARQLDIPHGEVQAVFFSSWLHLMARDVDAAADAIARLEALSTRHGLRQFQSEAVAMRGCLLAQLGTDLPAAVGALARGLAEQSETGVQLKEPWFMATMAEALAANGETTKARALAVEAVANSARTGELMDQMQALTVAGDLWASTGEGDEAVACFEGAIALARRHKARSMELRASTRLARLQHDQGRSAEARALLGNAYGWFTEGLDTPDLREARALLDSFDAPPPRATRAARRDAR